MDKELASGEYFMKEADRKAKKFLEKKEKQLEAAKVREEKRNASFIPPAENPETSSKKKKSSKEDTTNKEVDIEKLKKKVKRLQKSQLKKKTSGVSS